MQLVKMLDYQEWDGGDRHVHRAFFSPDIFPTEEDKKKFKGQYNELFERSFMVFDSLEEYTQYKNGELKKQALAKLTPLERAALGY